MGHENELIVRFSSGIGVHLVEANKEKEGLCIFVSGLDPDCLLSPVHMSVGIAVSNEKKGKIVDHFSCHYQFCGVEACENVCIGPTEGSVNVALSYSEQILLDLDVCLLVVKLLLFVEDKGGNIGPNIQEGNKGVPSNPLSVEVFLLFEVVRGVTCDFVTGELILYLSCIVAKLNLVVDHCVGSEEDMLDFFVNLKYCAFLGWSDAIGVG